MSAAAMLASDGFRVLVLEAAHAPGGCSSSYYRQGYWFETGATTLIGFDEHQPLRTLEQKTGITIPRIPLDPSMQVHLGPHTITRYRDSNEWISHLAGVFGNGRAQAAFWNRALDVAEVVWQVSDKNWFFPPRNAADWWKLLTRNDPLHVRVLPYALASVSEVMKRCGLTDPQFERFVDEQLMITAQAKAAETPFLFGAPALTYANYTNYYVPGGLLTMIDTIRRYIEGRGGALHTKEPVCKVVREGGGYRVFTTKTAYRAPVCISNIPVWNMPDITSGSVRSYFEEQAARFDQAWGAFTLGMVTDDDYPPGFPLHHQVHVPDGGCIPHTASSSVFVSLSDPADEQRAVPGKRVLNVSCHTAPASWFTGKRRYEARKHTVEQFILELLDRQLPGFRRAHLHKVFSGTPVTWENWVYRKRGRVGGIPQRMGRSLIDWTPAKTPFKNLYLCGDTVYPGQGIPAVTLSGINVYYRITNTNNQI